MVLILQFVEVDPVFITSQMAWSVKYLPSVQETRIQPLGQKDPLEKEMATHSSILPRKSHGQRSLTTKVYGVTQSRTRLKRFSSSSSSSRAFTEKSNGQEWRWGWGERERDSRVV